MYSLFAMLYMIYLFYYATPPKQIKKLIQCKKNSEQLEAEIQVLKNTIKTIITMSKNETLDLLATCPNFNNCSRNPTSF
jgi:hypothetical protein